MENGSVREDFSTKRLAGRGDERISLSAFQKAQYEQQGYLLLEGLFPASVIERACSAADEVTRERSTRTVLEANGETVRTVYGVHQHHRVFDALGRSARLLERVKQALGGDVYVYQSKLNTKAAFDGEQWPWHQDYVYWQEEDGMPTPRALTAAVFLDDVTELNGAMMVIPGSHREGVLPYDTYTGKPAGYEASPDWIPNLTAKMKYMIPKPSLIDLAREGGCASPTGRAGSVLLFHSNLAHASPANLSPFTRTIALYTYNRVDNAPHESRLHRPEFLVSRDTRAVGSSPELDL